MGRVIIAATARALLAYMKSMAKTEAGWECLFEEGDDLYNSLQTKITEALGANEGGELVALEKLSDAEIRLVFLLMDGLQADLNRTLDDG